MVEPETRPDRHMSELDLNDIALVHDTASDSAERFVRALIFWGELGPGDMLPPATEFAARLGISRVTLRLALKSLESTGYLVTTRGAYGGSRVTDVATLSRCWAQWMAAHVDEIDDVFEFRTTVESKLAALAAERRDDTDLAVMDEALAVESADRLRASQFRADAQIHRAVARAAHSPRLARAMNEVRMELFLPVEQELLVPREGNVHDSHTAIVTAIRERDQQAAAAAAAAHTEEVRRLMYTAQERSAALPR
jgi:GntR family transcriptional repressor for pyruvate dehydrogenase complex